MKQKDIALIIIVVIFSGIISFVLSQMLFGGPKHRDMKAEVVDPITFDFTIPDKKYFNENSINPTQTVIIGTGSNSSPFTTAQ